MRLGMFMMPYHDPRRDLHQALHERMAHHIGIGEAAEGHPLHPIQHLGSLHKPTDLARR